MEILRPALNALTPASMKALPKRKGNRLHPLQANCGRAASMKVPPSRKGNTARNTSPVATSWVSQ